MTAAIDEIINTGLEEDILGGDITSLAVISKDVNASGKFLIKQNGIIAGLEVAERCFHLYDEKIRFIKNISDGDKVLSGEIAAQVYGSAISLLTVERTALNFLQRMSGIATTANIYQQKINHTKAKIIDTRKTVPGLRVIDKLAVTFGGCENHRMGLFDMFLIKDNHIAVAGSITSAVNAAVKFKEEKKLSAKIEVETKNLAEVEEALSTQADIIMLDNFSIDEMKKAVSIINGKCRIEASGGITLDTIKEIAETGVDYISVGALTHSVKALDISLEIETE